jgi:hypothetical protein
MLLSQRKTLPTKKPAMRLAIGRGKRRSSGKSDMLLKMRCGGKQQTPDDGLMMHDDKLRKYDDKSRKQLEGMLATATTAIMSSTSMNGSGSWTNSKAVSRTTSNVLEP